MAEERCFGCGALFEAPTGPTHAYMLSVPGCWVCYCELQAWKVSLITQEGVTEAQRMVDSYAIQHATNPEKRNRQSVTVHLSLCANLEYDIPGAELRVLMGGWTHREYLLPESVPTAFPVTVRDVADAADAARPDLVAT